MALAVQTAITQNRHLFVEAGTGTGKTLAVWTTPAYKWQDFGTPLRVYLPSVTR